MLKNMKFQKEPIARKCFWFFRQQAEQLFWNSIFIWEDDTISISVTTTGLGSVVVDWTRWLHWANSSLWSLICVTRCSGYGSESGTLRDQRQTIPTSSEAVSTELSGRINSSSVVRQAVPQRVTLMFDCRGECFTIRVCKQQIIVFK